MPSAGTGSIIIYKYLFERCSIKVAIGCPICCIMASLNIVLDPVYLGQAAIFACPHTNESTVEMSNDTIVMS